jgi:hypothetical protein
MNAPPKNASGPAGSEAYTRRQKVAQTLTAGATDGKALLDVTGKCMRMPRNASVLYPNQSPRSGADWAHFRGVLRMLDGRFYWALVWQRICNDRVVLELKLELKDEPGKPLQPPPPSPQQQFLEAFHAVAREALDASTFSSLTDLAREKQDERGTLCRDS